MSEPPPGDGKAAELRRAFDRSFAQPPPPTAPETEDLLSIRVGGDPYAIRLRDIAGIVAGRKVVPVPTAAPGLLGLAGVRGGIVPVFGLAAILGYGPSHESPRWMVVCGVDDPIALAFSELEAYLRLPASCLHADQTFRATRPHVDQVVSTDAGIRAVIGIPNVMATIRNRGGHERLPKEH
jgi:chemotaxis signal transduction protein